LSFFNVESEVLAVFVQHLLLNLVLYQAGVCVLTYLNVHGADPIALVQTPEVPLLDTYDPFQVG